MSPFSMLRKLRIGTDPNTGRTVYSKRNWRAFFLLLIAGQREVVLNARLSGRIHAGYGAIIVNCHIVPIED